MEDLIKQGAAAFKAGDVETARKLLRQAANQFPDDERAWGWMYNVCDSEKDRIICLRQILRINPKNEKAQKIFLSLDNQIKDYIPIENQHDGPTPESLSSEPFLPASLQQLNKSASSSTTTSGNITNPLSLKKNKPQLPWIIGLVVLTCIALVATGGIFFRLGQLSQGSLPELASSIFTITPKQELSATFIPTMAFTPTNSPVLPKATARPTITLMPTATTFIISTIGTPIKAVEPNYLYETGYCKKGISLPPTSIEFSKEFCRLIDRDETYIAPGTGFEWQYNNSYPDFWVYCQLSEIIDRTFYKFKFRMYYMDTAGSGKVSCHP